MARGKSVSELKDRARRAEKREEWPRAIELYREALEFSEEQGDLSLDLSLYNRIGDLHRRQGETDRAVECYREAVDRYAEQGLHTGAVALCNKILRLDPDRVEVHRQLGRIHAETGLLAEARNAFRTYAGEMEERGERASVHDAYVELARLTGDVDLLVEVLDRMIDAGRREAAVELLGEIADEKERRGEELPGELEERRRALAAGEASTEPGASAGEAAPAADPAGGGGDAGEADPGDAAGDGPEREAPAPPASEAGGGTPGTSGPEAVEDGAGDAAAGPSLDELLIRDELETPAPPSGAGEGEGPGTAEEAGPDPAGTGAAPAPAGEARDPDAAPGEPADEATDAARSGPERAAAGAGAGGDDEGSRRPPDKEGEVDLGERIRRRLQAGDAARTGAGAPPAPGEFDDMLAGFRAQAAETSGEADPAAHVELGVALQQMGLLDDAVREFQVAARAPEPPVRAFELLGECFLEKGLHSVAIRVLRRALRLPGHPDHEMLGVLHQLGVAHQSVEEHGEALDCFERVFSVDIDFRDVAERMSEARSRA